MTDGSRPVPRPRLLLVTYQHPPIPFLGGDPWSGLATQLRLLGHELTIVTTGAYGALATDRSNGVVRTFDLTAVGPLRRLLRRPPVAREGEAQAIAKAPPAVLTRVIVPDAHLVDWAAWAIPVVRRLIRRRRIECVITTSPPDSTHLLGLALGRDRPPWIADFRDGWMYDGLREPFPTSLQRRLDARLEALVVRGADRVITHSPPLFENFQRRFGCAGGVVPNAWDTALEAEVARATPPPLEEDRVNLVYTGTLAGVAHHDARGLLEALRRLVREDATTARRLRLVIAGRLREDEAREFTAPDVAPLVRLAGALPRPVAIALQRRADALLLVTSAEHRSIATGKLFEYLAARVPILALAGENEAARIIRETRSGEVVAPGDVDAIAAALGRVADRAIPFAPRGTERYTYEAAAGALAGQIEGAIAERAHRVAAAR